nr:G-type lectin S-receptor-like serine/threonine-protein kinase SD3-1 [Ipomoea batatas]
MQSWLLGFAVFPNRCRVLEAETDGNLVEVRGGDSLFCSHKDCLNMLRLERVAITSILIGFLFLSVACSKIPLGSRLSGGNGFWASENGDFAMGFFRYCGQYSVGIKFNSSSVPDCEQTVVWLAGASRRVGSNSYFELTGRGELVLFDSGSRQIVWTSNTSNADVESAVLGNDGNFVLLDRYTNVVWQSFSYPSDTLLPGQNLSAGSVLRATSRNSVASVYTLSMDVSGQLQLRWETSVVYWTKGKGNLSDLAVRALLSSDGSLQLLNQESKPVWSVYGEDHGDLDVKFRFLRLDSDGNLRLYSWANGSRSWVPVWQAFENQCGVFATCGLHGICVYNSSGSHFCKCPFPSSGNSSSDCLIPYDPNCASNYSILRYNNMFLYGIYPPNETVVQTSLQRCWRLCQEDPQCHAVSFINNGSAQCHLKTTQYVSGWSDASSSSISLVKTCSDPMAVLPSPMPDVANSKPEICLVCVIEVSIASCIAFVLIQFGIGLYIHRRRRYIAIKSASAAYSVPNASGCAMLSYSEIKALTENFNEPIGPTMFKGVLSDGRLVAVKHLDGSIEERKFRSAVVKIGSICHKNLVKLEAYCCESGYRFLVYEYAKNGSLDKCLEDPGICRGLTWAKRVNICLTVARAMYYLHTGCREFISHGNLKCQNVVLDDELGAKVSEFGLRVVLRGESHDEGPGETDVRDIGRMMVVLITGCQNADEACKRAYDRWMSGESEIVTDKRMEGAVNLDELERTLRLVFWCVQGDERMRPSMGEVVQVLEGRLPVDPPPPLYCHHNQTSPEDEQTSTPSSTSGL